LEGSGKNVVLLCEVCGERIVLGGPVWVWNCGSTSFACGCGAQLTLSHQLDHPETKELAEPLHR
jgi:tRNA G26 N,N-dimethylase Trm1